MAWLTSQLRVHQDIRPANILVTSVTEMELHPHLPLENVYHFKLCDLGLTRFVNAPPGARAAEVNDALGSQSYGEVGQMALADSRLTTIRCARSPPQDRT